MILSLKYCERYVLWFALAYWKQQTKHKLTHSKFKRKLIDLGSLLVYSNFTPSYIQISCRVQHLEPNNLGLWPNSRDIKSVNGFWWGGMTRQRFLRQGSDFSSSIWSHNLYARSLLFTSICRHIYHAIPWRSFTVMKIIYYWIDYVISAASICRRRISPIHQSRYENDPFVTEAIPCFFSFLLPIRKRFISMNRDTIRERCLSSDWESRGTLSYCNEVLWNSFSLSWAMHAKISQDVDVRI